MSERRRLDTPHRGGLITAGDEVMADADVEKSVAMTGTTPPPQFTTYRPPAIEEDHSTDSTTPTYATAYHSAATGAEELSSLWGGRPSAPTPMDPAIQRLRSI